MKVINNLKCESVVDRLSENVKTFIRNKYFEYLSDYNMSKNAVAQSTAKKFKIKFDTTYLYTLCKKENWPERKPRKKSLMGITE